MLHYFSRISDLLKKNSLAVILIFAAIVRLTLFLSQSGIIWADSTSYYLWAVEIAETFTFTTYPFYRTPFYSMFLSPFLLFGESILAGRAILLAQYTLGVLTVFYLYKIARLYFSEKVAFLAAMLFSLDVLQLYYETVIQTEVLFCFLLVLTSYQSLVLIEKQDSKRNLIFLGISIGLLTLTRPIGRLFFIVVLICSFIKNKNFKNTIKKGGIIFTFYYLTILPWQIINYHTYNHWGLSLDMGINLFHRSIDIDKLPLLEERDYRGIEKTIRRNRDKNTASYFNVLRNLKHHKMKATEIDKLYTEYSLKVITKNLRPFIINTFENLYDFFFSPRESVGFCYKSNPTDETDPLPYFCSKRSERLSTPSFKNRPSGDLPELNNLIYFLSTPLQFLNKLFLLLSYLGFIIYLVNKEKSLVFASFAFLTIGYFSTLTALLNRAEDRMQLPLHFIFYIFCAYFIWLIIDRLKKQSKPIADS